jgi:hypothetical protein
VVHHNVRETDTLSRVRVLTVEGPVCVCDEEDVLFITSSPSSSTHEISSAVRHSESAVWHTVYENQLYPFSVQP